MFFLLIKEVIRKEYLEELERFKDKKAVIKVITGVRRCGKSTLLLQYMERLKRSGSEKILFINFEDASYDHIRDHGSQRRDGIFPSHHVDEIGGRQRS
ncbi:MAG: AAA family ATPase [Candidatus Methanoplasma sp.]|nr:AAA family ATPase [Candidatus Methanoplasma sp.]